MNRIQKPVRVARLNKQTKHTYEEEEDDTHDKPSSDDVREFIKQCVQEELQTIKLKPQLKSKKVNVPQDAEEDTSDLLTCKCGKQIKSNQYMIHKKSKFHMDNI